MVLPLSILSTWMKSGTVARENGGRQEAHDARVAELWVELLSEAPVVDLDPRMSFRKFTL